MEYINEISIKEAVIHVLDCNGDEPVFNEYPIALNEEIYEYLLKHLEKCFKDEELKYALFSKERNIVKDISQEYLRGESDIIKTSRELASQLFLLMKSNGNIPSADIIVISFSTEYGPMLGILKMDYIKNYTHTIDFVDNKIDINIIPQLTGLPSSGQKIQKCAFIKTVEQEQSFNLMVIDKGNNDKEEYGSNYFINNYLGCTLISNERDNTKSFVKASENWTRKNLKEDAEKAEQVRSTIKKKLKEEENIDVEELSKNLFKDQFEAQKDFVEYVSSQGVEQNINVDKQWVDKKLKRVRLKVDSDIDIYVNEEAYDDHKRFEVVRNGDGTINIVIKHIKNYIEK